MVEGRLLGDEQARLESEEIENRWTEESEHVAASKVAAGTV